MLKHKSFLVALGFSSVLLLQSGCSNYEPVASSKCGDIVNHTKKILGKFAKSKAVMIKECKTYSDIQRGCAMQANTVAALGKCAKL
jgi:hypothetical protein